MRRHAIALAFLGWYLVVPPTQSPNSEKVAFSSWTIKRSFDSAERCEKMRAATVKHALRSPVNAEGHTEEEARLAADLIKDYQIPLKSELPFSPTGSNQDSFALCIASNDPRLRYKHESDQ